MSDYQIPRDSIYYYGEDSTYKPGKYQSPRLFSESKPKKYIYELDAQGLPVKKAGPGSIADELEAQARFKSVVRIGGREYNMNNPADVADLKKLQEQELTRQRNSGLGMSDIRGGDGLKSDGSGGRIPRGTDLGNSGPKPMNWAEYEEFLNNYGKEEGGDGIRLSGFESNDLPGGIKATLNTKPVVGISQAGASSEADINDQSRAIGVDQTQIRALPRGARQRQKFLERNPNYGRPEAPKIEKGSGISARGRAILDAPMGEGAMGVLRRANAAQNIVRNNGKIAIKDAEGNFNEITQEGYDKIRSDMRDQKEFSQEFLSNYLATPAKPADAQSPSSVAPKPATKDLSQLNEANQSPIYPNMLQNDSEDIPDMGPDPKMFELGILPKRK